MEEVRPEQVSGLKPSPDLFIRAPDFAFTPHPLAPLFPTREEMLKVLGQLISELSSPTFSMTGKTLREYLRQMGLVQLWFFERFILGATGPYEQLNTEVHLDMANFGQSELALRPGALAAAFLFRGIFKTTIFGSGRGHWLCTRDGNQRYLICMNTAGNAARVKSVIKEVTETNPLYGWLYPEAVPKPGSDRWNKEEIVFPHRTRTFKEPSVLAMGIDSILASLHCNDIYWDDLAGLEGLDSTMNISAVMETAKKNFRSNRIPLLQSKRKSRTFYASTFYAPDDVSMTEVVAYCRSCWGYQDPEVIKEVDGGDWDIYYRSVVENGTAICPEIMDEREYEALLLRDPWTALTQYANSPRKARQGGLTGKPRSCRLGWDKDRRPYVVKRGDQNFGEKDSLVFLGSCFGMVTVDPAGTDDKVTSRTSRSSVGVWFRDSEDNLYRVWQKVGYIGDDVLYDAIFEANKIFSGYLIGTVFEKVAMQKVMYKQLQREQAKRGIYLALIPDDVRSDKEARIRHGLGGPLRDGKIFLADGCATEFMEELLAFPSPRLDVLDESEKALRLLPKPLTEVEEMEYEETEAEIEESRSLNAFGY